MEGEPQKDPKFPLWIIEYVWAHKTTEIQDVVDPSDWPDLDSQPLSLQDSWRLRVASARVYSIVKTRDMEHFERVMGFLEATYRLLPRLVTPIKHMKIMFGLKTMVIMWMLSEGRGMVDTVLKTSHFFPRTLPQYQDQCTQREMFLMRQTHLDFKALAQALAVDKDQLDEFMKSRMEEQYGERYAQKVVERLLHYLQQLEAELPRDTYVDQILKKGSPVTEEEKLLLEVVTSDSTNIATTLKKMLLHCDVASCRPARISPSREASASCPQVSPLLVESVDAAPQVEEDGEEVERTREDGVEGGGEVISARRFCSKHQRWSSSILQACPDPEELRADASSSPLLFPSSSSTASSQDLTPSDIMPGPFDIIPCPSDIILGPSDIIPGPSDIILCPPDRPSLTSAHLQTAVQTSERANPGNEPGPPSDASQRGPPPNPQSRDPQRPFPLLPVVQLVDILACCSPAVQTSADRRPSGNSATPPGLMMDTTPDRTDAVSPADPPNIPSHSTGRQPATRQSIHELSRRFRLTRASSRPSQALVDGSGLNPPAKQLDESPSIFWTGGMFGPDTRVSGPPTAGCAADQIPPSTGSPGNVAPQNSFKPGPRIHNYGRGPTSDSDRLVGGFEPGGVCGAQLRLSLQSQELLLQSTLLQPYVALRRLSAQQRRHDDDEEGREEDADSSFDVNTLYSSSGSEDSFDSDDPEYTPR